MKKKSFIEMNCSIAQALDQVGEWWSLLIVRECMQGTRRFDEFQRNLGIARNILTLRLEKLISTGVFERYPLEDRPHTDGYRLTQKGQELYPVLIALLQWGDKWAGPDHKPPMTIVEDSTGEPIEEIAVRNKTGRQLSFREVRFDEGPGATDRTRHAIQNRNQRVLGRPGAACPPAATPNTVVTS